MSRRSTILLIALGLALTTALLGCAQPPIKRFYTIINDKEPVRPLGSQPLCHRQLVVESVESAVTYDLDRIVFRNDEFEVKHFSYEYWVSPPRDMFSGLLTARLEREHLFSSVQPAIHASRDYLGAIVTVDAIELIADSKQIEARLAMTLRLRDTKTDQIIWEHRFDTRQPVHGKRHEVEDTVRTLSAIYNAELRSAVQMLSGFLPSYSGCAEPNPYPRQSKGEP